MKMKSSSITDKMTPENLEDFKFLTEYISKNKEEYLEKYFSIGAKYYLPINEGLESTNSVLEFMDRLDKRIDISGKICDLEIYIETLNGVIKPFPGVRIIYENEKGIVLSKECFLNDLIIGETLEEVKTALELIKEVE